MSTDLSPDESKKSPPLEEPTIANVEQVPRDASRVEAGAQLAVPAPKEEKPFSVFTSGEKWTLVVMAGVAGTFR